MKKKLGQAQAQLDYEASAAAAAERAAAASERQREARTACAACPLGRVHDITEIFISMLRKLQLGLGCVYA